jgi:cytoskeletal protein CcmA (bactofilin family)
MSTPARRFLILLVVATVALSTVPGLAAAEPRAGGTVIVEAGETTGDLEVFGGDIVIRGTVDGDLQAIGGNVRIVGTVTGSVDATAGNVFVGGTVEGDLRGAAGHVQIAEGSAVEGDLEAGAGSVLIAGSVGGNARIGAESITLDPAAAIGGSLEYEGTLNRADGAQVAGGVTQVSNLGLGAGPIPQVAEIVFSVYFLLVNIVVGAILLLAFPRFSEGLVDRTVERPGITGLLGVGTLVAGPLVLVLVALTIVGIPLSLVGIAAYVLAIWLGIVYGRYVLGAWVLSLADVENRWLALLVGMLGMFVVTRIPVLGGIADLAVLVWGLGALALGLYAAFKRGRAGGEESTAPAGEGGEPAPA